MADEPVGPTLKIGDAEFKCRGPHMPDWPAMKLAKWIQASDSLTRYAGMYDFLVAVIEPAERKRFEAFMDDYDGGEDDLDEAIGALIKEYSGRPTVRPSSSPPGPPTTGGLSRVVSLSPGTAKAAPTSSRAGRSAAS